MHMHPAAAASRLSDSLVHCVASVKPNQWLTSCALCIAGSLLRPGAQLPPRVLMQLRRWGQGVCTACSGTAADVRLPTLSTLACRCMPYCTMHAVRPVPLARAVDYNAHGCGCGQRSYCAVQWATLQSACDSLCAPCRISSPWLLMTQCSRLMGSSTHRTLRVRADRVIAPVGLGFTERLPVMLNFTACNRGADD